MLKQFALLIAAGSLASACMSATDNAAITNAVTEFHDRQARGEDAAIYQGATPDLRAAASLQDLTRLDAAVRAVQGCSDPGANPDQWNNAINTSGHFITATYNRRCGGGPLVETFVFRMDGAQPLLQSYNASGMALFPAAPTAANPTQTTTDTAAPAKPGTP
jgi:hypothetical protein